MNIRILTADDVNNALPMGRAIEMMRLAFGQFSAGQATMPLRSRLFTDQGVTLLMPAHLKTSHNLAVKIVSVYGNNPTLGLPTVTATVIVLDPDTGMPLAFLEGDTLTALRTGAAGGLAADLLARKDAKTVTLFGAGIQGRSQLQAVLEVRPITQVNLIDSSHQAAETLMQEIRTWSHAPEVQIVSDLRAAVRSSDIVLAATTSSTPLFDGNDLEPGTHGTGVGSYTPEMQEIDKHTVHRARVVVDSREACLAEAGDIILANAAIDAEIGEIVNREKPGRQNDQEITFFKSVGVAAQDAAAAGAVLEAAEKGNIGTIVQMK